MAIVTLLQMQSFVGRKTSIPHVRRVYLTPYPYLIDYYVGDDEIVIQRFRHTARKPAP
jgi:toxin ParE1/3/4